jgi:hypothetical protein
LNVRLPITINIYLETTGPTPGIVSKRALQHNPDIKIQNQRLLKNGKSKMSALCAAMRKLVHICFGVIKHQRPYQVQASLI